MIHDNEVDHKMLKGFYFAYKDGKQYPSSIRHHSLKDINITPDEFISSQRRLMQKGFLNGTKTQTTGGTIWTPNEISNKGIEVYESTIDPLFRGVEVLDTGFNGKKYRFWKWIQKHWMAMIIGIVIPVIGIIITVVKP